jgi:hypothetical protein
MVSTLLVLSIAAVSIALTWALLRGRGMEVRGLEDWEAHRNEVDFEMFRWLIDPAEERYLQQSLSKTQSRNFLRKRIGLALRVMALMGENAALLTKLAELARGAQSTALVREAEALSTAALRLRMNLGLMKLCLWIKWCFPNWSLSVPAWEIGYNTLLNHLVRVQNCAYREARIQG